MEKLVTCNVKFNRHLQLRIDLIYSSSFLISFPRFNELGSSIRWKNLYLFLTFWTATFYFCLPRICSFSASANVFLCLLKRCWLSKRNFFVLPCFLFSSSSSAFTMIFFFRCKYKNKWNCERINRRIKWKRDRIEELRAAVWKIVVGENWISIACWCCCRALFSTYRHIVRVQSQKGAQNFPTAFLSWEF